MKPIIPSEVVAAMHTLREFINPTQLRCLRDLCKCEEKEFFFDKLRSLERTVQTMPKTYQQDGLGEQAIASLHYFAGGQANWYITERDVETKDEPGQHQAFGLADLFADGGELGYISIVELLENNAELDLYFEPTSIAEIRAKQEARRWRPSAPPVASVPLSAQELLRAL